MSLAVQEVRPYLLQKIHRLVARLLDRGPKADAGQAGGADHRPLRRPAGSDVLVRLSGNLHARLFNLLVGRGFEVLQDLAEQKECRRP